MPGTLVSWLSASSADRGHDRGLLLKALVGLPRAVDLGDQFPAHLLGVLAHVAQFRWTGGDDRSLVVAFLGNRQHLRLQLLQRSQDTTQQQ